MHNKYKEYTWKEIRTEKWLIKTKKTLYLFTFYNIFYFISWGNRILDVACVQIAWNELKKISYLYKFNWKKNLIFGHSLVLALPGSRNIIFVGYKKATPNVKNLYLKTVISRGSTIKYFKNFYMYLSQM